MSRRSDDDQQRLMAILRARAASGEIDRRTFLRLAMAVGIDAAVASADEVKAASPKIQSQRRGIASAYDYIVVGAGSAGCTIAARLSEDSACRVY